MESSRLAVIYAKSYFGVQAAMLRCPYCTARFSAERHLEQEWIRVHIRRFHALTRATADSHSGTPQAA